MRRHRSLVRTLVALVLAAATATGAVDAPPIATSTTTTLPEAIPVGEIPADAEATLAQLYRLRAALPDPTETDTVAQSLPDLREELSWRAQDEALDPARLRTARDLQDIKRAWLRTRERIERWTALVGSHVRRIESALDEVRAMDKRWARTATEAVEDHLPQALLDEIANVRSAVAARAAELRQRRDGLLTLATQLGALQGVVVEHLGDVEQAFITFQRGLLAATEPPIWAMPSTLDADAAQIAVRRSVRQARDFVRENRARLVLYAGVFLVVLLLARAVRRQAPSWQASEELRRSVAPLVAHPWESAAVLTMLVAVVVHRRDPMVVTEVSALLTIVPLARVLGDELTGRLRTLVPALGVVIAIVCARGLLPVESPLGRVMMVAENVAAVVWLVWLLRDGPAQRPNDLLGRLVVPVGRLSLLLLAIALVANVVGAVALALVITQGLMGSILLILGVFAAGRVMRGFVAAWLRPDATHRVQAITRNATALRRWIERVGRVVAWTVCLTGLLQVFGWLTSVIDAGQALFESRLDIGELSLSFADVVAFAVTVWVALVVARVVRALLEDDVLAHMQLPRGVPAAVSAAANYLVITLGLLFALSAAGLDLGRVTLLAGALGVGIGFGLQNVVNNFVSGLILLFERPMRVGDVVELGTTTGTVRRIGIRSSTIESFDGAEVIVPNADLIAQRLVNWTFSNSRKRIDVPVGVAYGSDPGQVLALLERTAAADPSVLRTPPPQALFQGFGESSLDFMLRAWTYYDDAPVARSRIVRAVYDGLAAAGIGIPFPQRELRLVGADGAPLALASPAAPDTETPDVPAPRATAR